MTSLSSTSKKHETDPDDPAAVLWRGGLFNTIRFLSEGAPPGWDPRAEKKALAKATAKNSISIHAPRTGHDLPV